MRVTRGRDVAVFRNLALLSVLASAIGYAACGGSPTAPTTPQVPKVTVVSVAVTGATPPVGATSQFTATASMSDGTSHSVTGEAAWESSNNAAVTISSAGVATGVAPGEADITATYRQVSGRTRLVIPRPAAVGSTVVNSVQVTGTAPAVGTASPLTATAVMSDGSSRNVTSDAAWHSSNPSVASVSSGGGVSGVRSGEVDITAVYQQVSGKLRLVIASTAPTLTGLSVVGTAPLAGATSQFVASAMMSDGTSQNVTTSAAWRSSDPAVATVSAVGIVTGVARGEADITAEYQHLSATSRIEIAAPAISVTAVAVAGTAPLVGGSAQFSATATQSDGTTRNVTALATWRSSNPSVATVTTAGLVGGLAAGEADISAEYQQVSGKAHVVVAAPPCAFAVKPSEFNTGRSGGSYPLTVTVTQGTACAWTAQSHAAFITLPGARSGTGGGTVQVEVAPNDTAAERWGTLTIAGVTVRVHQLGPDCVLSFSPREPNFTAAGGSGAVDVVANGSCSWSASSDAAFITVLGSPDHAGSGAVKYTVGANAGTARVGYIRLGDRYLGLICPVRQDGTSSAVASSR